MQKPLMSQEIILCGQDKASTNTKSTLARKGHMMIVIIQVSKKYDNAFAKYHWSLSHVVPWNTLMLVLWSIRYMNMNDIGATLFLALFSNIGPMWCLFKMIPLNPYWPKKNFQWMGYQFHYLSWIFFFNSLIAKILSG